MATLVRQGRPLALLWLHLAILPRWFVAPAAIVAVVLGGVVGHAAAGPLALAVLSGLALSAWAHMMNSVLDYEWTKLDRGEVGARSKPKPYTGGQSVIPAGIATSREVTIGAGFWLVLSLFLILPVAWESPWVWAPWLLTVPLTFWYSWAKTKWHPEVPLALGFGPFATLLGFLAGGIESWWLGLMAGVPLGFLFGFVAEWWDQAQDGKSDWPKWGRSLGVYGGWKGWPISVLLGLGLLITSGLHAGMVALGALAPLTLWALFMFPMSASILPWIEQGKTLAVLGGLGLIFLYSLLVVVLQATSH